MSAGMVSQKGANARMCAGGAARVEETGELGRWFRERSSPGWAAVRRRSGAEGETVAESVPEVAEGEVGGVAEVVMVVFFAGKGLMFLVHLRLARGGEGGVGDSRDVCEFGTGSEGQRLFSHTSSRLMTCIWAGKSCLL